MRPGITTPATSANIRPPRRLSDRVAAPAPRRARHSRSSAAPGSARGGTANRAFVTPNGINYLGSDAPGGASWVDRVTGTFTDTNARVGRNLATPWTNATEGTYFMSFVVNFGAMAPGNFDGDMGYRAMEFHRTTNNLGDGDLAMLIGYNAVLQ